MSPDIINIVLITFKSIDYHYIIYSINKCDTISSLKKSMLIILDLYKMHLKEFNIKNRVCNCYFDYLIKAKQLDTKIILIDEKNNKDSAIYFTRCDCRQINQNLDSNYHELMGKIKEHKG